MCLTRSIQKLSGRFIMTRNYMKDVRVAEKQRSGGYNGGPKRTSVQREADLVEVAKLYVRGYTITAIVQEVNAIHKGQYTIAYSAIDRDIKEIRRRWAQSSIIDFNEAKARELAKLDELEHTYWDAWLKSTKDVKKNTVEQTNDTNLPSALPNYSRSKAKTVVEERDGNIEFLKGVERCVQERCKLLNLYPDQRITVNWRKAAEESGMLSKAEQMYRDIIEKLREENTVDGEVYDPQLPEPPKSLPEGGSSESSQRPDSDSGR